MYVGVILFQRLPKTYKQSIPHVCGGDPYATIMYYNNRKVFPMYVGVIL